MEELKRRAEAGDVDAVRDLGMAYIAGEGVVKDVDAGIALLWNAVHDGDECAPNLLGQMFLCGEAEDDESEFLGMYLLGKSARRGYNGAVEHIAERRLYFAKRLFCSVF